MNLIKKESVNCCVCSSSSSRKISHGIDFEYNTVAEEFIFRQCTDCFHTFLNPRPTCDSLKEIYPKNYGNYSNSQKFSLAFTVKSFIESNFVKKLFKLGNSPESILDIGCGDGRLLSIVQKLVGSRYNLEGIEISEYASLNARKKGFRIYNTSLEKLNLVPDSYDYIFMIQVLEHLHKPVDSLVKIRESLKVGGILVIETPDTECIDYNLFSKRYWGGYHYPRHFNLFNKSNLCSILKQNNFKVLNVNNKLQPVHWIWSFHHLLTEKFGKSFFSRSFNIKNSFWVIIFTIVDSIQLLLLGKSSNQQIICQKQSK